MGQPTTSADDGGVGVMASGPRDGEGKGERGDGRGRCGDDNVVSTWSHMTAIERKGRGERRRTVAVPVMETGEEALSLPKWVTPAALALGGDG